MINMINYRLPDQSKTKIISLYRSVRFGKNTAGESFDIYDYEFLFKDEKTIDIIKRGKTIGCFYIESPGMRSLLTRLNVDTFEMLTAASSIIRPGVAESGMMQEFIARHKDPRRRKYLIPEMEKILGETYGVMIYQEDVIKVAHHVAGLSLEEADFLRRAMSGKLRSKTAMQRIQERFFESCDIRGLKKYAANELWRQISSFAGYAFCKAHSASFALLSYQVAYLKVHHPAEFMSSVLSNGGGYYSAAVYIQEIRRLGLAILLPCINKSIYEYTGSGNTVRIGLLAIKNLRRSSAEVVVEERKANGEYKSLKDFLVRTHAGFEDTVHLIKCGAMDCFGVGRPDMLRQLDIYVKYRRILDRQNESLFADEELELEHKVISGINYTLEEKCLAEMKAFDYMVSRHPLQFYEGWINNSTVTKAIDIPKMHGKHVKMIGWFMTAKRIKTKSGKIMKFLSLEDLTDTFEAVLFPETYAKYAEKTMSFGPYLVEGKVDAVNGNNLIVDKLEVIGGMEMELLQGSTYSESSYTGENEKIFEEETHITLNLDKEKLVRAYAG
jgi:DNA polymerase III alpha subunit